MNMMSDDYTVNAQETTDKNLMSRRKLIQLGAYGVAGLAVASTFQREQEAEAVSPAFIYAALMAISAAPILRGAWQHIVSGRVTAENRTREPQIGYVLVTVLDARNQQFNVSGRYGPFQIPPGSRVALPYSGLVPNGSGLKLAVAHSYVNTASHQFNWPY
jgi:hypothetical protein